MTRGSTGPQIAADIAPHAGRAILVEMLFDSGALRLAIADRPITVGADTYVTTGAAFAMSAVDESVAGFEGFQLSLAGVDAGIMALMASEPYRGRTVRVLEPRFDAADAQVGTARVQAVGRMRALSGAENVAERKFVVTLQAEHYDAEFDEPSVIRFTDADQQRRYAGDLGAEYLASLQDRVITRDRKA